jgi:leucyl aminopeptidase
VTRVEVASSVPSAEAGDLVSFRTNDSGLVAGIPRSEFDGAKFSLLQLRQRQRRILHVGLGEKIKVEEDTLRRAAGVAVKNLLKIGADEITIRLEGWTKYAQAVVEGALLAAYSF